MTMCPQELCGGTIGSGGSPWGSGYAPTSCVRWAAMRTAECDAGKSNGFTFGEPRNPVFYYWHNAPTNAPRSPVCRCVPIPDKLLQNNSDGTNRSQNAQRQCSRFDKVTVTHLRLAVTRFAAATALKQRRIDILRISGAGRLYDLHP